MVALEPVFGHVTGILELALYGVALAGNLRDVARGDLLLEDAVGYLHVLGCVATSSGPTMKLPDEDNQ